MDWTALAQHLKERGAIATPAELKALGLSADQLRGRLERGEWQRVLPSVIAATPAELNPQTRQEAVLEWLGADAALSHSTAAAYWLIDCIPDDLIHATVPYAQHPRKQSGVRVHRSRSWSREDWYERSGLRVARLERVVVDLYAGYDDADMRYALVSQVLRDRRTTPARLREAAWRQTNLRGRAELLRDVSTCALGVHSVGERLFWRGVLKEGIEVPQLQLRLRTSIGIVYLDAAFKAQRVAVEIDGQDGHGPEDKRRRDLRRDAALAAMGWLVVRVTVHRLRTDLNGFLRELAAILESRKP